jgi:hypothetical protein
MMLLLCNKLAGGESDATLPGRVESGFSCRIVYTLSARIPWIKRFGAGAPPELHKTA